MNIYDIIDEANYSLKFAGKVNFMTNSLIPYSFVPGTKAKAQEVNANFIALAGQISENKTDTDNQLSSLEETITERIDSVESSLASNYADNNLANTGLVTNTVVEAPNGIADYDSQTINVKSGLKVLIPDGKTDDGKLKNIEYTTENIITKTVTNLTNVNSVIFLSNSGEIDIAQDSYVFYKNTTPSTLTTATRWYNTDENQWYKYDTTTSEWVALSIVPIALAVWNANSVISSLTCSNPINLVKVSDLNNFYSIKGVLPQELDYVVKRYKNNWEFYTLYKSGWVKQGGYVEGNGDTVCNFYYPINPGYHISSVRISGSDTTKDIGLWVRDVQSTYIKLYSTGNVGKTWCVEGYATNLGEI